MSGLVSAISTGAFAFSATNIDDLVILTLFFSQINATVVFFGGVLYLIHHGFEPATYQVFQGESSEFRSPSGVVNAVLSGSRRGIIQLGLLLLIATPILRVVISLIAFILQRELTYIVVTLLVLASLTYSLVGAYF